MTILVASVLLCTAAGCADPTDPAPARPEATITTTGECARISFQITGSSSVTTWYPSTACTVGLVVIRSAGASTWNGSTRTLTLKLRVANTSTEPVTLPVRLELPVEGKTVTLPEGVSPDSLVPLDMDSTLADDRKLWLVGGTGETLAPGDSSETRTLTFQVKAPVTKGRFWFVSSGEEIPIVPATAPDSLPDWFGDDSSYTLAGKGGVLRYVVSVEFAPGATQAEREAAIDSISGVVVGGRRRTSGGEGIYYVHVQDDGTGNQLRAAVQLLEQLPQVVYANLVAGRIDWFSRRPDDGAGWHRSDWTIGRSGPIDDNWYLEELQLPLAWGCETGDPALKVGVIDQSFNDTGDLAGNYDSLPSPPLVAWPFDHGLYVTSVLAARGDNGMGSTGVLWRTSLRLRQVTGLVPDTVTTGVWDDITDRLVDLGRQGVQIVSFSGGVNALKFDTLRSRVAARTLERGLQILAGEQKLPLLVVAAGNAGMASYSGPPQLAASSFASTVVVVGGSALPDSLSALTREVSAHSATGNLIDLYAPADRIWVPSSVQGQPFTYQDGTSLSTPMVAGIAGLLKSVDPTLTPAQLKDFIVRGAQAGGTIVNPTSRYVANAYQSLKLLARERTGIPLCGNRVFVDSTNRVFAERGGSDELLYASGQTRVGLLRPYHGGRRLRLFDYVVGDQDLTWSGGSWSIGAPAANPPEPPSGTWFSLDGLTHDGDSLAYPGGQGLGPGGAYTVNVSLGTVSTFPGRPLGSTSLTLAGATTYTPTRQGQDSLGNWITTDSTPTNPRETAKTDAHPSPLGDHVLLVISRWWLSLDSVGAWTSCGAACQQRFPYYRVRSEDARVFRVPWGGGTVSPLWTVTDSTIGWLGIAEDGGEVVVGLARVDTLNGVAPTACFISYRDPATGAPRRAIRRSIQDPTACDGGATRGDGGLSPIITRDATPALAPQRARNGPRGSRRMLDLLRPAVRPSPLPRGGRVRGSDARGRQAGIAERVDGHAPPDRQPPAPAYRRPEELRTGSEPADHR